ncbi:hypothetical protein BDW75DRAFT_202800 [Aspergillus navahoensis]
MGLPDRWECSHPNEIGHRTVASFILEAIIAERSHRLHVEQRSANSPTSLTGTPTILPITGIRALTSWGKRSRLVARKWFREQDIRRPTNAFSARTHPKFTTTGLKRGLGQASFSKDSVYGPLDASFIAATLETGTW